MSEKYIKNFNGQKVFSLEYDKETLKDMVLEQQEEIERLQNKVEDLQADYGNKAQVERDLLEIENKRLQNIIKEVREWIRIVQTNEDRKHLEPIINTDELDHILEILDKGE